jgi:hypothetical protein
MYDQLRNLLRAIAIIFSIANTASYATVPDSTQVPLSSGTPQERVVESLTWQYGSQAFSTGQTVYSPTALIPATCPSGTVSSSTSPPMRYTLTTHWYATHFHYECGTVAGPASCVTTNGHDPTATQLSGPSTIQPSTVCVIDEVYTGCSNSDFSCDHTQCSHTSGTWYQVYTYTPDPNGTFTAGLICIQHGWAAPPID